MALYDTTFQSSSSLRSARSLAALIEQNAAKVVPAVKAANQTIHNNTFVSITDLTKSIAANQTVVLQWRLKILDDAGGIKFKLTAPAGAGGIVNAEGLITNAGSIYYDAQGTIGTELKAGAEPGANGTYWITVNATVVNGSTAGTVALQFAQVTTDGSNCTIYASSAMVANVV